MASGKTKSDFFEFATKLQELWQVMNAARSELNVSYVQGPETNYTQENRHVNFSHAPSTSIHTFTAASFDKLQLDNEVFEVSVFDNFAQDTAKPGFSEDDI